MTNVDMARNLRVEASTVRGLGTARPSLCQSAAGADQFWDGGKAPPVAGFRHGVVEDSPLLENAGPSSSSRTA